MPQVGNKKFAYTKKGMEKAKTYAKKRKMPMKNMKIKGNY
tara:strand:+ start:1634 stop:1753 length:120 start_codon:yes stop_codon:yes gene_type:complete